VRAFGHGFTSVLLAVYLIFLGGGETQVIASLGLSLASAAAVNVLIGRYGERFGRRRTMAAVGVLMGISGVLLAAAPGFPVALMALALGATSPTGTEVSPFLPVEQSIVAEASDPGRRTRAFAVYNLAGTLASALGSLASGLPALFLGAPPMTADPLRPMFLLYAGIGIAATVLSLALPRTVEVSRIAAAAPLTAPSRSRIARMASLFAVDSYAGGFVLQSFVAFWFFTTYPESLPVLGVIFFLAGILSALSFLAAARLGERYGLLETMVFTHLPANVLLILIPLAPGFLAALGLYLARMALSQMDVPTRQAYLAGIVAREERTTANAVTGTARNVAQAAGPFSAGLVIPLGLPFPFLLGGGLKIAYDVSVFVLFRRIKPTEV